MSKPQSKKRPAKPAATKTDTAANSAGTAQPKPRGRPWPKGVSGNPKGAPKRGESWKEIIQAVSEMTADEIAAWLKTTELADSFKKMPKGITLKTLVVARVFAALMFEPQASLLTAFMDRAEGKVADRHEVTILDSLASRLGVTKEEARTVAERITRGEITIEDVLTGKVKVSVDDSGPDGS